MNILGAPTNLGLKPYDEDGTARGTTLAPARYRDHGIVPRLGARDLGDVPAAAYRDFTRLPGTVRNEDLVLDHTHALAAKIAETEDGFTIALGGDCSILFGNLLGHRRRRGELGLIYIDGHDDANTPATSETGGTAGMDLAIATGHGDTPLARLTGNGPLVREEHIVTFGIRDRPTHFRAAASAADALQVLGDRDFFIHFDVDALDPEFMPFVDEPVPGGFTPDALASLLAQLVHHPRAVGMEVTIYDPKQDPEGRGAALIVEILENAFAVR